MHLAKLFSYHMESYKELTCEFLASMRYHMYEEEDRADLDQGLGWITFLAKGEKRMVTFRQLEILFGFNYGEGTKWNFKEKELQRVWATIADGVYSSSRSKAAQIRSPVLRYVHKALANTFFARKATGTINEGELKFLDMGIKPILSRTSDGKRIRGDRSDTGNLMPFLDHLLTYKITAYNTRHQRGRRLSVGGLITPILCAAGVNPTDRRATEPGWMDIKFCKTNLLIEHKESICIIFCSMDTQDVFWSILEHMGQGAWRDLAHGSSSTGYAKEEGRSHLEDQLDRLLDQPVEFLNSTGQASTRSS
ncbi:unnamed protein product [Microthlaspi erraticum]|uniref:Arabidopsis retrotransposon Orf1 C-terminal domain-containing protein n=1 Tax=Microthlaspi erraticum TaxID=1685480 RepID=A0A6D2JJH0_9BRAS|nr:unnamed protein product [Microthlaspi erraticum]